MLWISWKTDERKKERKRKKEKKERKERERKEGGGNEGREIKKGNVTEKNVFQEQTLSNKQDE